MDIDEKPPKEGVDCGWGLSFYVSSVQNNDLKQKKEKHTKNFT